MTPDRFFERGRLQSRHPRAAFARESFLARIARLRGLGLENAHTTAFLRSQMEFHRTIAPLQMLELDGIADGFALDLGDICPAPSDVEAGLSPVELACRLLPGPRFRTR